MVPVMELPPATPLTSQETEVFVVLLTVAEKTCVLPARRVALEGETETLIFVLGCVTWATRGLELAKVPPGSRFFTKMVTLPACPAVALPVAVSWVAETTVVARAVEPK